MLRAEVVAPTSERWGAALGRVQHDLYHLPGYAMFSATHEEQGQPVAVVVEDGDEILLLPLILRDIPAELTDGTPGRDAISPKFYPGPILSTGDPQRAHAFATAAIEAMKGVLREHGVVSAFVRMHPLLTPPSDSFTRGGRVVDLGDTVSIDLRLSDEELWRQTRHNHRRDINKARRAGYHFSVDPAWTRLDEFVECYGQSMARLDAHPSWRLSRDYFEALREHVGEHVQLGMVELDGELASGALLTRVGDMVEYHLGGTLDHHLAARPSKLLIHEATMWAKRGGATVFHLAGSLRRGDNLEHFKLGFSPLTHTVSGWQVVADQERYDQLVAHSLDRGVDPMDGFFPAYRRQPAAPPTDARTEPRASGADSTGLNVTATPSVEGDPPPTPGRWEAGSELHLSSETGVTSLPWDGQPVSLWGSGRDAIRGIFEWGQQQHGWRRLLMPSYFCQDVVGSTQRSASVELYPWAPTDQHAPPVSTGPGDVVFIAAMFGAPPAVEVQGPGAIIEDHSHDLLAPWAVSSTADYAIVSLRKTLPLPDGGAAWSPAGHELPPEPELTDAHARSVLERLSAMILKRMYLDGDPIEKDAFRTIAIRGEKLMAGGAISGISAFSRTRLATLPTRDWHERRARNRAAFLAALGDVPGVDVLDVPFAAILVVQDAAHREHVRKSLIDEHIYPSVLWPLERPVVSGIPQSHLELSRRMLSIHCDHRYLPSDMERVADVTRRALGA